MAGVPSGRGRRLLEALVPGTRVAGYRLEAPVGAGGMAAVYRAHDEALDRVVALKLVYAGPGIDQLIRQRFVREALSVAKVDHPHIIPVYSAGEADDMLWIAMRFVAGGDLRTLVERDGPLTPARVAAYISPVASALDTAHEEGLVHRDVKPANLLVDPGRGRRPDHVYLSDFGLARGVLSVGGLTQDGQFVGTPDYAAPEQIKGQLTDGQADQYSLACVAYTLLTGLVPYVRESPMAVLYAQLDEPPPRVTDVAPHLPREVDWVLAKALAKRPGRRYENCGEFADELRSALGVGPYDPAGPVRVPPQPGAIPPGAIIPPAAPGGPLYESTITDKPVLASEQAEPGPEPSGRAERTGPAGPELSGRAGRTVPAGPAGPEPSGRAGPAVQAGSAPAAKQTLPLDVQPDAEQPAASQPAVARPAAGQPAGGRPVGTPAAAARSARNRMTVAGTWSAVVTADHAYYDSVQVANEQEAEGISFPDGYEERRIELARPEMSIGRRSRSRHIEPDIDLTGDPGVSRLHAVLTASPDGTWRITDKASNGTQVNGQEIPAHEPVPLRPGDYINLGVWTRITVTRD